MAIFIRKDKSTAMAYIFARAGTAFWLRERIKVLKWQ